MRRKFFAGALASALMLGGALAAFAQEPANSTVNADFRPGSAKAGTKKTPRANSVNLILKGGTKDGMGQPATSTSLNVTLPKQWRINSEDWPRKQRCDIVKANQARSDSVCPKGSKIGSGKSIAKAGGGGITQNLTVTAFVIKNGDLGFFLRGTTPVTVAEMIQGVTSKRRQLNVKIPSNLQEPVDSVTTGITLLQTKLGGTARINGKRRGLLETTGCGTRNRWLFTFKNVYRGGGSNSDSDTPKCRK